jgi:glyoxylase-like metal-dependent hydrolase (beta-lactamase superfamily II)
MIISTIGIEPMNDLEIIHRGDSNGNQWIIRLPLPSGRALWGLATENIYGGDWDLGPTWNYIVQGENPFLIDTGRFGMGGRVLEMLKQTALRPGDLKGIFLTHGHEDHDGGLSELARETHAPVWVHPIYDLLRRSYPGQAPLVTRKDFSASCWHCFMPETFTRSHCREYHRQRDELRTNRLLGMRFPLDEAVKLNHLPGHCPDALAYQIGSEALIVGDTLLPDITPHPSQEALYPLIQPLLPPEFRPLSGCYGLRAYIRSLKRLAALGREFPRMRVLPAHRLFYKNRWGTIELGKRSEEIIEHHLQRCASILEILKDAPKTAEEIARAYYEPKLLKGLGIRMAENEIKSHLELLEHSRDILWTTEGKALVTGKTDFENYIRKIDPELNSPAD